MKMRELWASRVGLVTLLVTNAFVGGAWEVPAHASDPTEQRSRQVEGAPATLPAFELRVFFDGLIAFVPEYVSDKHAGRVWALLVDADWTEGSLKSEDLPPCVFAEGLSRKKLKEWYPSHETRLRFRNAKLTSTGSFKNVNSSGLEVGESIAGKNIRLEAESAGTLALAGFEDLGQIGAVHKARSSKTPKSFDTIDKDYLVDDWTVAKRAHVSARVLLDASALGDAELVASPVGCKKISPLYGFSVGTKSTCGSSDAKVPIGLAEEVLLKKSGLTRPIKVDLGDQIITVEPALADTPVVIEVLNVMTEYLRKPDDAYKEEFPSERGCYGSGHGTHHKAYRWFYWLAENLDDPLRKSSCKEHFRPCEVNPGSKHGAYAGGRKCPQRVLAPGS